MVFALMVLVLLVRSFVCLPMFFFHSVPLCHSSARPSFAGSPECHFVKLVSANNNFLCSVRSDCVRFFLAIFATFIYLSVKNPLAFELRAVSLQHSVCVYFWCLVCNWSASVYTTGNCLEFWRWVMVACRISFFSSLQLYSDMCHTKILWGFSSFRLAPQIGSSFHTLAPYFFFLGAK